MSMIINLLVSKSEEIINNLPDDTSEHSQYVRDNSEKIIEEINPSMEQARREHIINQYKSHIEAKKIYLNS